MDSANSISTVNTSNGWAVRQVNPDGTELFVLPDIFEPKFSEAHAHLVAESLRQHLGNGGKTYAKPLPAGVKVEK